MNQKKKIRGIKNYLQFSIYSGGQKEYEMTASQFIKIWKHFDTDGKTFSVKNLHSKFYIQDIKKNHMTPCFFSHKCSRDQI